MYKNLFVRRRGLLAAIALLLLTAGCGIGSKDADEQSSGTSEKLPETLTLAVAAGDDTEPLKELIGEFDAAHPGFDVKLLALPADRYSELLNMRMTSGEGPDVFRIDNSWLKAYELKNYLTDLSTLANNRLPVGFPQWALDFAKTKSHYYAVPSEIVTLRLIYNKQLFESAGLDPDHPPATLAEMRDFADRISEAGIGYRRYGFALPAGDDGAFLSALETAGTRSGVYYYDYADGSYDFGVYRPWFETMLDMKREGGLFPGETSLQRDTALTQFSEGNIGMMFVTDRDFAELGTDHMNFELGIAMPPLMDNSSAGKGALKVASESSFVINDYSEHKQEAADLWQMLLSREFLGSQYKGGYALPAMSGITGDAEFRPALGRFDEFLPGRDESPYPPEPQFVLPNDPSLFSSKNIGDELRMKAYRTILQGVGSPADVLKELSEQYNKSLKVANQRQLVTMEDYINASFDPRHPLAGGG